MPQDKRLIVTKAVVQKVKHLHGNDAERAGAEGVYLEFIIPSIILQQYPSLLEHIFHLPHPTFPKNGRSVCLIVPKVIALDCTNINKRYGYFDAVITAEAICKRGDTEAARRAAAVATTFSHFVVDARIVAKLPDVIHKACASSAPPTVAGAPGAPPVAPSGTGATGPPAGKPKKGKNAKGSTAPPPTSVADAAARTVAPLSSHLPKKYITSLPGLDDRSSLAYYLSQSAKGGLIRVRNHGQCYFRVGNGAMVSGDVCDNAKTFVVSMKREFPIVWKLIHEMKLSTNVTDKIRFMEVNIQA